MSTRLEESDYALKPYERPMILGSPASPDHPAPRRYAYFAIGCLICITQGLGNGLVSVNLNYAQGTLGLYSDEATWLTAAYFMVYASANLVLVKFRQQFGLQRFVTSLLVTYVVFALLDAFAQGFWSAVAVRAISAISAAGLSSMGLYYLMQSMPAAKRMHGMLIGISVPQLATPLARVLSPGLLETGNWHRLNWFELGMAVATLAAVMMLPLPPSERRKVFEPADFLTLAVLGSGLALFVAVFSEGRIEWWTERVWLGWALAGSIALIAAGLIVERCRINPLINTRWLGTREVARIMLIAAAIRILLSEQTFGSVGLLTLFGMLNDQMITLNTIILIASIAGIVFSALTLDPTNPGKPITVAAALIAMGAFMDAGATNLSRPENFYLSQGLIGFASLVFLGRAMVIISSRMVLAGGQNYLVSFVVVFNISQSVGGIVGGTLLGTFQTIRERFHSNELVQSLVMSNPVVAAQMRAGVAPLSQRVIREANVLAYNDVFLLVGVLASVTVVWGVVIQWLIWRRREVSPLVLLQQRIMKANQEQADRKSPE
ncbi:MFS transporter [Paraburkholderia acidicola]|uniref:MFS transporter n=1 Tax=Paraburkholderia acidicola TaxID=1912599 RepID=A0ABV1LX78_9BURK